jgi:hypothetical protein
MAERLRELDALLGLDGEYLRELPYLLGREFVFREYEAVVLAKRTLENPLGAYTLTPENVHSLSEEELAEEAPQRRGRLHCEVPGGVRYDWFAGSGPSERRSGHQLGRGV